MLRHYSSYLTIFMCILSLGLSGCGDEEEQTASAQPTAIETQAGATEPPPPVTFLCGKAHVRVTFNDATADAAQMHVGEEIFDLTRAISASGARYEGTNEPSTSFWNKGTSALVVVMGHEMEECHLVENATTVNAQAANDAALPALQNTSWVLRNMNGRTVIDNVKVTMSMDSEGRIGGRSGCNNYAAGYELDGNRMTITEQMAATMMACVPPAIAEQEAQYLDVLHKVTGWTMVEPNTLVLSTSDNKSLSFTPDVPATAH